MTSLALAAAIVAALGYGSASVLQGLAAQRAEPGAAVRHPWYLAGTALDVLAWLISLVALRALPVYEVQAVLASSVAVTAVLAYLTLGARLRRRDVAALVVAIAGLALLAAASGPAHPQPHANWEWLVTAAAPVVAALGLVGLRTSRPSAAAAFLAGTAYGGAAICAQQITLPGRLWTTHTLTVLATDPLTYAFLVYAVAGMALYAAALERGDVGPATALLWIGEVLAPSAVAALLLHQHFRPGWTFAGLAAVVAILAGALVLAAVEPQPEPRAADPIRAR